jgi:hypothetical protein
MMDSMNCTHTATTQQRDGWQEAALDQQAYEATYDLPGLVERVLQNVWKRLGLPAREAISRPLTEDEGELPSLPAQDTSTD